MSCLFGGNSCTWVLILVIVFLLSQNNCGNDCGCSMNHSNNGCGNDCGSCGCGNDYNSCGCSCGC